jgi:hypothetical protein
MISFKEWLAKESSAATRLRWDAALGLKPPIPPASVHSHSTGLSWQVDSLSGATKKKRRKKRKKRKS